MPWTWSPGGELLAQQADRHLGDRHRVAGVHAGPRRGRGVRLVAGEGRRRSGRPRGTSPSSRSDGQGCTIIATSRPSNAPPSSMRILPPPPSSAGVPEHDDRRADLVGDARRARCPRRGELAAITLWPQACPTSGSASYSAQTPDAHRARCRPWRRTRCRGRRRRAARRSRRARAPRRAPRSRGAPRRRSRGARAGRG